MRDEDKASARNELQQRSERKGFFSDEQGQCGFLWQVTQPGQQVGSARNIVLWAPKGGCCGVDVDERNATKPEGLGGRCFAFDQSIGQDDP